MIFGRHPDEHPYQRTVDLLTVLIWFFAFTLTVAGIVR